MSDKLQNATRSLTLMILLVVIVSQWGCQPLSNYRQRYSVRVLNAADEAPAMVDNVILIFVGEYEEPFLNSEGYVVGSVDTPDETGLVEYVRSTGAICVDGGNKNYPSCEDEAALLDINGQTLTFLIEDGDYTETIEIDMQEGNQVVGQNFMIEVVTVSPLERIE